MKPIPFVLLAALTCLFSAFSHDEKAAPAPATPRVIGDLPDGTPPPPEPPKPAFSAVSKDILDTEIHEQGGRKIIIQEINPIALPPPPMAVPPVDKTDPALQARIAAFRAKYPRNEILRIGASVYHLLDSTPRTLVTYWPNKTDEPPVTLWSSADFSLLWGFASFIGSDGKTRSLMMTWSNLYTDCRQRLHAKHGKSYIAREAELKAHPPKPKDIILNYSLTDSADQPNEKGTARGTQATTRSTPGCSDLESEPLQSRQFPPDLTDKILRCEDSLFRPVYPGAFTSTKCDEEVCWKILPIVFDSLFVGHMFRTIVEGRFAKSAPS